MSTDHSSARARTPSEAASATAADPAVSETARADRLRATPGPRPIGIRAVAMLLVLAPLGCDDGDARGPQDTSVDDGREDIDLADARDDGQDADDTRADGDSALGDTENDGVGDTAADTDTEEPEPLVSDLWGGWMVGLPRALSRVDRTLWIGTLAAMDPADPTRLRGGLLELDLDHGDLRLIEGELPQRVQVSGEVGPAGTSSVARLGDTLVVASQAGLLVVQSDGGIETLPLVEAAGPPAMPFVVQADPGRGWLWAGTSRGLYRLGGSPLAVQQVVSDAVLGSGAQVTALAVEPDTGAVDAVLLFENEARTELARVEDGAVTGRMVPGRDGAPNGFIADVVWSQSRGQALAALAAWQADDGGVVAWDGRQATTLLSEGALSMAARGQAVAFGAAVLALDEERGVLAVGGWTRAGTQGGGIVFAELDSLGAGLPRLAGVSFATSALPGDHVTDLELDPARGRLYAALRRPCNETKLANAGVVALRWEGEALVIEAPFLSGVRDLDFLDGRLVAALRDDAPGVSCSGTGIRQGVVSVQGDRSGALLDLGGRQPAELGWRNRRAMSELDVRGADLLAVAGWGEDSFAGPTAEGVLFNQALIASVSLMPQALRWEDDTHLWIGGRAVHDPGDAPELADRGPRGAARLEIVAGKITNVVHYVATTEGNVPGLLEVDGLPSSEIVEILPAPDGYFLVCGTEWASRPSHDREELAPFERDGVPRRGGIAQVTAKGEVVVVASGEEVPDARAATLDPEGVLHVLDAQRGLLKLTPDGMVQVPLPMEPVSGSIPRALWLGEDGDLVAGYSTGAVVSLGGKVEFLGGVGHVWSVAARPDGVLLLGTDQGLLRVMDPATTDPGEAAAPEGDAPPYREVDVRPGCGAASATCVADGDCCAGLVCTAGTCQSAVTCEGEGATCNGDGDCCAGLVCGGGGFVLMCVAP